MQLQPREYQTRILETAKHHNTLVVLPTGMGKTLIALLLSKHRLENFPTSKILFLAPTKPLAEQHFNYFKQHLPELYAELQLFTGKTPSNQREKLWKVADIIFSTPQCISNDLKKRKLDLQEVSLLIEDECHRCIKNYAYTHIAQCYLESTKNPRILGLTASPGSDQKTIAQICDSLNIEKIEIRDRQSKDVKPYIQKLDTEIIKVDFPPQFQLIQSLLKEIYNKKTDELKNRSLLFGPATKKSLLELQAKLGRQVKNNHHFNILRGLSVCAQAIKLSHALELLETQGIQQLHNYFKALFEQANSNKSRAVKEIIKNPNFTKAYTETTNLINMPHPKLQQLEEIIKKEIKINKNSKFIVFAQYRDTVALINKVLNKIPGIKSTLFVGQLKKGNTGMNQKEQQQILAQFKENHLNTLIATSIGEEGLDIPEVSCVIFYEPIPSAIRKIQRTGRTARLKPGKLIILMTAKTRDEAYHWASKHKEKKMYRAIENLKKKFDNKKKKTQLNLSLFKPSQD